MLAEWVENGDFSVMMVAVDPGDQQPPRSGGQIGCPISCPQCLIHCYQPIRRTTRTERHQTILRRLIERILLSYRPLRLHVPEPDYSHA
ncbi:hypothetical protein TNCV_4790771 [Trichonephila clavipes]|nr:hypothetical protein TNCV_4790771 [Trichonephila clavipes]